MKEKPMYIPLAKQIEDVYIQSKKPVQRYGFVQSNKADLQNYFFIKK